MEVFSCIKTFHIWKQTDPSTISLSDVNAEFHSATLPGYTIRDRTPTIVKLTEGLCIVAQPQPPFVMHTMIHFQDVYMLFSTNHTAYFEFF